MKHLRHFEEKIDEYLNSLNYTNLGKRELEEELTKFKDWASDNDFDIPTYLIDDYLEKTYQ